MKKIGVRELRQRASEFLRDVERGQVIEVMARGRLVARLVPVKDGDRRAQLASSGRITTGTGDVLAAGAPLRPRRGHPAPSVTLSRARANER